jgi:Protein of unknown function (DUF2934)
MPDSSRIPETVIRETAYYIWEREGRPDGRDQDHWLRAAKAAGKFATSPGRNHCRHNPAGHNPSGHNPAGHHPSGRNPPGHEHMEEEEKVLAGHPDANMPSLLTKDVPGG